MLEVNKIIDDFTDVITLPSVYLKVKEVLSMPESSMADLANAISYDPGISVRMLKVVNSAYFAQPKTIETVSRAINILGTQQVHDIVLATCLSRSFENLSPGIVDMETYWMDSVLSALLASELAKHCNMSDRERMFVIGLLRDIGHLLMYQECSKAMRDVYTEKEIRDKTEKTIHPLSLLEQEMLNTDFSFIGMTLMEKWKLPEVIYTSIGEHLNPNTESDYIMEASILQVVWSLIECKDVELALEWISPVANEQLNINKECLEEIYKTAKSNQSSVYNLFFYDGRSTEAA